MATKSKMADKTLMELAEKAPKRSIAANMTIFQAMAAERDGIPDIQSPNPDHDEKESDDDVAMIVEEDVPRDTVID